MLETINSTTWAAEEARKILEKINYQVPKKGFVLFCSGYGPSGMPHIGTFGEIVRTSFIRFAFIKICEELVEKRKNLLQQNPSLILENSLENGLENIIPTRLFVISDDYDGMRKVPENVPQIEMLKQHLQKPLTSVPNPFNSQYASYGEHMNSMLVAFLEKFAFTQCSENSPEGYGLKYYTFISATQYYKQGKFNDYLIKTAEKYNELMAIMLPSLREERRKTYSPIMPIDNISGKVIQEGVMAVNAQDATVTFVSDSGEKITQSFLNGGCKLQWKCDFGMRWAALDVDYELYGKDHHENEHLYQAICKTLSNQSPLNYFYELFLSEDGKKISKSKGNGITIDEWMRFAPAESLAYYMFVKPRTAKRLHLDVIPKVCDEYLSFAEKYLANNDANNPAYYICAVLGETIKEIPKISFSLLLNLTAACNAENTEILWGFVEKYYEKMQISLIARNNKTLNGMVCGAIEYYNTYVKPQKKYRQATQIEATALQLLASELLVFNATGKSIGDREQCEENAPLNVKLQNIAYAVAKAIPIESKQLFAAFYQVCLGEQNGPRFGSFAALYSPIKTSQLITNVATL
jgi:lysyl-tRNA synthetase class 1